VKKYLLPIIILTLILAAACTNPQKSADPPILPADDPVEYFAVLAEKDDYSDVGMTDLLVDYIDIQRVREALEALGWDPMRIHDLKEFDRESLITELDWLEENADQNDLVFMYITGHGTYLRDNIGWSSFFPQEWAQISGQKRVLLVDACTAAEFTQVLLNDPYPQLVIAAVDDDEYGWKGVEEEGLPIIGGVFTYYFTEALTDPAADGDANGQVSVQEAALAAEEKQREYMHEVVFAVPDFVEMFHGIGAEPDKDPTYPDVIMNDTVGEDIFLESGD
jgi:hypothetical protein